MVFVQGAPRQQTRCLVFLIASLSQISRQCIVCLKEPETESEAGFSALLYYYYYSYYSRYIFTIVVVGVPPSPVSCFSPLYHIAWAACTSKSSRPPITRPTAWSCFSPSHEPNLPPASIVTTAKDLQQHLAFTDTTSIAPTCHPFHSLQ